MLSLLRSHLWFLSFATSTLLRTSLAWKIFTVPHLDDNSDDTPALQAVLNEYSTDATILFEKGVYYNIYTPIRFPELKNVEVRIEGNLSYPKDMATIQGAYALGMPLESGWLPCRMISTYTAIVASPVCTLDNYHGIPS